MFHVIVFNKWNKSLCAGLSGKSLFLLCVCVFACAFTMLGVPHTYVCTCVLTLGIRTDEPALFANSWAVDLPHERACPSVDLDFSGPCQSESDMDVRTVEAIFLLTNVHELGPPQCTMIKACVQHYKIFFTSLLVHYVACIHTILNFVCRMP